MDYFKKTESKFGWDETYQKIEESLKKEGFGILTEINVKEVLKKKLDVDRRPYKILGACNPHFAKDALERNPEVGVLLPCNIIMYLDEHEKVKVSAFHPGLIRELETSGDFNEISQDVEERIGRVLDALS